MTLYWPWYGPFSYLGDYFASVAYIFESLGSTCSGTAVIDVLADPFWDTGDWFADVAGKCDSLNIDMFYWLNDIDYFMFHTGVKDKFVAISTFTYDLIFDIPFAMYTGLTSIWPKPGEEYKGVIDWLRYWIAKIDWTVWALIWAPVSLLYYMLTGLYPTPTETYSSVKEWLKFWIGSISTLCWKLFFAPIEFAYDVVTSIYPQPGRDYPGIIEWLKYWISKINTLCWNLFFSPIDLAYDLLTLLYPLPDKPLTGILDWYKYWLSSFFPQLETLMVDFGLWLWERFKEALEEQWRENKKWIRDTGELILTDLYERVF